MDSVKISSSSSRAIIQIPQAREFYEELSRVIEGTDETKTEGTGGSREATEEKSALNDDFDVGSYVGLYERTEEIHKRFLVEAEAAFRSLTSVKSSKVVVESEETERIVAISSLIAQILKFQELTGRHDQPLTQLRINLGKIKKKFLAVDPFLSLGISASMRKWGTMTVNSQKASAFPAFDIPLDPIEAFAVLEKQPLSDRCKVQILVKIFQEIDTLVYTLGKFERNVTAVEKESKGLTIQEIVKYFSEFPHLFSKEDQRFLQEQTASDACDLKVILGVIEERKKGRFTVKYIGGLGSIDEARRALSVARSAGFDTSFIVEDVNGQLVKRN